MVEIVNRKTFQIRESGRSTDFIAPSFGYGCLFNCTYCYMKRHKPNGLSIANNTMDIITAINTHSAWLVYPKSSNQTHPKYYTYDLGCNSDFALETKWNNWRLIFDYFKNDNRIMGSFATKYVNKELLTYNPQGKIRVRFSLIPQIYSNILESGTSLNIQKIIAINQFIDAGYDVHINFSPIIISKDWVTLYKDLFQLINSIVSLQNKNKVFAECIFLTHNANKHQYNVNAGFKGEDLLWTPENQEHKISQFGGDNIRYQFELKREYIKQFKELHDSIIPWNKIRYIF